MQLKKEKGGSAIRWEGADYEWPHDGSVTEVPDQLGRELLAIPEGGFERVGGDREEEEDRKAREFSEVVEVGYTGGDDAPSTPGEHGEVPDRLSDRTAYRVTEDGSETVPPEPAYSGEHPRAEVPGEGRAGVKDVDRAERPDGRRDGQDGTEAGREDAGAGRDGREAGHGTEDRQAGQGGREGTEGTGAAGTGAGWTGHEGKHEARRGDEPKRRDRARKPAAE
jgi:hypothetical protein